MNRYVIITAQSLVELFRDYFPAGDIPEGAKALRLLVNPSSKKFGIVVTSDEWNGPEKDLTVNFDIKRIFSAS